MSTVHCSGPCWAAWAPVLLPRGLGSCSVFLLLRSLTGLRVPVRLSAPGGPCGEGTWHTAVRTWRAVAARGCGPPVHCSCGAGLCSSQPSAPGRGPFSPQDLGHGSLSWDRISHKHRWVLRSFQVEQDVHVCVCVCVHVHVGFLCLLLLCLRNGDSWWHPVTASLYSCVMLGDVWGLEV